MLTHSVGLLTIITQYLVTKVVLRYAPISKYRLSAEQAWLEPLLSESLSDTSGHSSMYLISVGPRTLGTMMALNVNYLNSFWKL